MRNAKNENLFRSLWVQLHNVNATKKSEMIKKPEKYWEIPLLDKKAVKVPTKEEMAKAYEIGMQWQKLKFEEEVQFDSITKKIK